ncbi:MAG: sigma-70 family RNA polymerase sigma factor [Chloroflexota bacterium]
MTSPHEGVDRSSPFSQPDLPPLSHYPLRYHVREETACALQETPGQLEQAVACFTRARPRLFGIAYRIVGNAADAEDVVQDVWMRWQRCDRSPVQAPAAFLATTATRLAINVIQSAHARHETSLDSRHSGQSDAAADPALGAERREALEAAVLLLLERLSPAERAAYVLREAFEYPYQHIAEIIQATEATTRQLVSRARKHLAAARRKPVKVPACRRLLAAFLVAAQTGHLTALEHLLTADVISDTDGVRRTRTSRIPVISRPHVVKIGRQIGERSALAAKPQGSNRGGRHRLACPHAA